MIGAPAEARHDSEVLRGIGLILVSSVLFGAMAVFVRLATREMHPLQVALARFAGSLVLLLLLAPVRRLRPQPGNLTRLLVRGVLGAGAILLYFVAIAAAGAGVATLLHSTYPVFTALFAVLSMGERVSVALVGALSLNLVGAAIVVGPGGNLDALHALGAFCAVAAAVLAGGAVATARQLRASEGAILITVYFMAVGLVLTLPSLALGLPPFSASLATALVGVVVTSAIGQWLLHQGLGAASATQGSLACATSVFTTTALAALVLGERLGTSAIAGGCLMFAAVALSARRG